MERYGEGKAKPPVGINQGITFCYVKMALEASPRRVTIVTEESKLGSQSPPMGCDPSAAECIWTKNMLNLAYYERSDKLSESIC